MGERIWKAPALATKSPILSWSETAPAVMRPPFPRPFEDAFFIWMLTPDWSRLYSYAKRPLQYQLFHNTAPSLPPLTRLFRYTEASERGVITRRGRCGECSSGWRSA